MTNIDQEQPWSYLAPFQIYCRMLSFAEIATHAGTQP